MKLLIFLLGTSIMAGLVSAFPFPNEDDSEFSAAFGRLSRRRGLGAKSETKTFGRGRFGSFTSTGSESGPDSNNGDFNLESFLGFETISGNSQSNSNQEKITGDGPRPTVVETISEAKVDSETGTFAGGVSGVKGSVDQVDLESTAGVNEESGSSRVSTIARGSKTGGGNTSGANKAERGFVGAVAESGTDDGDTKDDNLFVRSSLRRKSSGDRVSGLTTGYERRSGSFGITFENDE